MHPRSLVLAVAALAATVTTACEPAPPPPTFEVDSFLAGPDIDPGDGQCLTAAGSCTVQAAVQEVDALGGGVVLVPANDSTSYGGFDATITGNVTVRAVADGSAGSATILDTTFTVASGGGLVLESIELAGNVVVDGGLVAHRVAIRSIEVGPTGAAVVSNALLLPGEDPALVNHGRAVLQYTTVALWDGGGGLVTFGDGETLIGATAVLGSAGASSVTCYGTSPTSLGYNAVTDGACALTGLGDQQGIPEPDGFQPLPAPGSPLIDAVPDGALGCGTSVTTDARGLIGPRPVDGDGDATAACDIGAYEVSFVAEG